MQRTTFATKCHVGFNKTCIHLHIHHRSIQIIDHHAALSFLSRSALLPTGSIQGCEKRTCLSTSKFCPYKMPSCCEENLHRAAHTFLTTCFCCFSNPRFGPYHFASKCPFDFDTPFRSSPYFLSQFHCDSYDSLTCLTWCPYTTGFTSLGYRIFDLDSMSPLATLKWRPL